METIVENIYARNLVTVKEDESLSSVDFLMNDQNIRHLPVLDRHNFLVGIISRTDIKALKNTEVSFSDLEVKSFMTSPVKVFTKKVKIQKVAQLFILEKISSAVIVENGDAVGIITTEDLLRFYTSTDRHNDEAEIMDLEILSNDGWGPPLTTV